MTDTMDSEYSKFAPWHDGNTMVIGTIGAVGMMMSIIYWLWIRLEDRLHNIQVVMVEVEAHAAMQELSSEENSSDILHRARTGPATRQRPQFQNRGPRQLQL